MAIRKRPEFKKHNYLPKALRKILEEQEPPLTPANLAELIGLSNEAMYRVVYRENHTSVATLENIAEALHLTDETLQELIELNAMDKFESTFGGILSIEKTTIPVEMSFEWSKLNGPQQAAVRDLMFKLVEENLLS